MPNYEDHSEVVKLQGMAQDASKFLRELVREQRDFLHIKDGMWDPKALERTKDQPRYTIDKTTPLIEDTTGNIKKADFGIKVQPVDNTANEESAEIIGGLIRNISNISGADHIYNQAVSNVVEAGLDGWEIVQEYASPTAFDQDILVKAINNFVDRVWFDHDSLSRTPEDARHAFKLTSYALDVYRAKWPKGSGTSLSEDKESNVIYSNRDEIIVGQVYYMKESSVELVRMSDGAVYEDNEKFQQIKDELEAEGITEEKRRKSKTSIQWIREYDGGGWLEEAKETVFEYISLVPEYGKFKVIDNAITARGLTLKQMDLNRIYNYAKSRQTGEVALAPREKFMATLEQIAGNENAWTTMNTNADPALIYNHIEGQAPPFKIGGAQVNMGLEGLAMSMSEDMRQVANKLSAQDGVSAVSGKLVDELKESSRVGDIDWTEGHEIALCYGYKVMLSGIKRVYDGTRTVRILGDDGTFSMEELNTTRLDAQTQEMVTINDLSAGLYDVVCSAGKSYKTVQGETISSILEIGAIDPNVVMEGEDILVSASDGPGMKEIAERIRARKFKNGEIPESQWTDEEREEVQQAQLEAQNQPQQPDPNQMIAEAEMLKGQAEVTNAETKRDVESARVQLELQKIQLENKKIDLETQKFIASQQDNMSVDAAKIEQGNRKLDQSEQKMLIDAQQNQEKIDNDTNTQQFNQILAMMQNQQAEFSAAVNDLKTMREAYGIEAIVAPSAVANIAEQSEAISDLQEE